jgi:hypothetical protein
MSRVNDLARERVNAARLGALEAIREIYPSLDEVRFKEAASMGGGTRWLREHEKAGHIRGYRRGKARNSPLYYSRRDIVALMQAEEEYVDIIINQSLNMDRAGRTPGITPKNNKTC